jgi:hypothetical protein
LRALSASDLLMASRPQKPNPSLRTLLSGPAAGRPSRLRQSELLVVVLFGCSGALTSNSCMAWILRPSSRSGPLPNAWSSVGVPFTFVMIGETVESSDADQEPADHVTTLSLIGLSTDTVSLAPARRRSAEPLSRWVCDIFAGLANIILVPLDLHERLGSQH